MSQASKKTQRGSLFLIFLKLGLTSFGGPIAHIGYFHSEFVVRRKWLSDRQFTELASLCHFLPGPASSQLGLAIGLKQGGILGSFAAWSGFTLPSALLMLLFGIGVFSFENDIPPGAIHGLKLVAVAVVAQAVIGMARSLTPDMPRIMIALVAVCGTLFLGGSFLQLLVIVFGALAGFIFLEADRNKETTAVKIPLQVPVARFCLLLFFGLLFGLPLLVGISQIMELAIFDSFYRAGSLVFGGGHVVLPLLSSETVAKGVMTEDVFLSGYAAAQALPGPLFTFAAYLGALLGTPHQAFVNSFIALIAIFAPAFLLVFGILPFWERVKERPLFGKVLKGVNASVVGLLAATLYSPLWTSSVHTFTHIAFCGCLFCALYILKAPSWAAVLAGSLAGWVLL